MKKEKIQELKKLYENVCQLYIAAFVEKHGYEFSGWVADDIGQVASFIDEYFFDFTEVTYDINTEQPKGLIFEWFDEIVQHSGELHINFRSYSKGLRYTDIQKKGG